MRFLAVASVLSLAATFFVPTSIAGQDLGGCLDNCHSNAMVFYEAGLAMVLIDTYYMGCIDGCHGG